jgi:hypothetical protein
MQAEAAGAAGDAVRQSLNGRKEQHFAANERLRREEQRAASLDVRLFSEQREARQTGDRRP